MRRNGLPLAIGVARQIDGIGGDRRLAKIIDDFAFARNDLQRRLKNLVIINAESVSRAVSPEPLFSCFPFCFAFFFFLPPLLPGQTNANRFSWAGPSRGRWTL